MSLCTWSTVRAAKPAPSSAFGFRRRGCSPNLGALSNEAMANVGAGAPGL